jgi:hypothetical protein
MYTKRKAGPDPTGLGNLGWGFHLPSPAAVFHAVTAPIAVVTKPAIALAKPIVASQVSMARRGIRSQVQVTRRAVHAGVVVAKKQQAAMSPVLAQAHRVRGVALRNANRVATIVTVHTPGFHALPKDLQKTITETPLIPSNMHELEDRLRVNRRFAESKLQYIDPVVKQFFEHEQRQDEMTLVQGMLAAAEADYKIHPTPEKYAYIQQLLNRLADLSAKEQKFMHNAKIFAVVVTIVASVFTMGTASGPMFAAWGSFVQAVGTGIAQGINFALSLVLSTIKKMAIMSELEYAQMTEALRAVAAYPPPKTITEPTKQIEYSLAQKTAADIKTQEQAKKSGSLFPLTGVGLTLLALL